MAEGIVAAISDPYSMSNLSFIHQRSLPIPLVDLGAVTTYIGFFKTSEEQHGVFDQLCRQAVIWEE